MKISINKKRLQLYLWIGIAYLVLLLFTDLLSSPETFLRRAVNSVWLTGYIVVINFIFFEYALPFIKLNWLRIIAGLLLICIQLLLYSFGWYAWRHLGIQMQIYVPFNVYASVRQGVGEQTAYGVFSLFFFGVIKYIYDYRKLKETAQKLLIEKQQAELNYLKSQTNPHFLFNTLNNIYSLARDKSDLAPESILRLSKILRFMLYETNGAFIAVEQELKIITDYIELEKLRYDESLRINFNHDIEDLKQALPPLLLIPLVENAFKHGVSETRGQPFMDIHLSLKNRQLLFSVKNSTEINSSEEVKENIGLSNLRRQLELQYTDYDLNVQQNQSDFTSVLKINLASHVAY